MECFEQCATQNGLAGTDLARDDDEPLATLQGVGDFLEGLGVGPALVDETQVRGEPERPRRKAVEFLGSRVMRRRLRSSRHDERHDNKTLSHVQVPVELSFYG